MRNLTPSSSWLSHGRLPSQCCARPRHACAARHASQPCQPCACCAPVASVPHVQLVQLSSQEGRSSGVATRLSEAVFFAPGLAIVPTRAGHRSRPSPPVRLFLSTATPHLPLWRARHPPTRRACSSTASGRAPGLNHASSSDLPAWNSYGVLALCMCMSGPLQKHTAGRLSVQGSVPQRDRSA
jgi:hypothetical protein